MSEELDWKCVICGAYVAGPPRRIVPVICNTCVTRENMRT